LRTTPTKTHITT